MRKLVTILLGALLLSPSIASYGQERREPLVQDGVYARETIPQRVPVPYPHLREADMMWTKRVWRILDLREKMNHPLYYPTMRMHDRVSLTQRLVDAIKFNEINAYDPTVDDEFSTLLSYDQVLANLGAEDREMVQTSPITGLDTVIIIPGSIRWDQIRELMIKEEWFFDKRHSTMQVRILGILPIRSYTRILQTGDDEDVAGEVARVQAFWVYFPHARTVLANTAVFNEHNDAQRISFDDLFFMRRFSSYIVRESNVYNNRRINEYTFGGVPNMLESEKIRYEIFNFEHDLWEY